MAQSKSPIELVGVKQNNLKNISVTIPSRKITVITGLSGSGKSSLAFDTLYAEGQRRYVESLSTYTRQFLEKMPKPEVETVRNIPPAIALEQKNHVVNSRSTVGTQTEISDYLRVLFARAGTVFCPDCKTPVSKVTADTMVDWALQWLPKRKALILSPLTPLDRAKKKKGKTALDPLIELRTRGLVRILALSNPKDLSECPVFEVDDPELGAFLKKNKAPLYGVIDRLRVASLLTPSDEDYKDTRGRLRDSVDQALSQGNGRLAFADIEKNEFHTLERKFGCLGCGRDLKEPEPHLFSFNSPLGACSHCSGFGFTLDLDEALVVPDPTRTLKNGAIDPFSKPSFSEWQKDLFRFCERHSINIGKRYSELTSAQKDLLWKGSPGDKTFPGILSCFEDLKRYKYKIHVRVFIRRYQSQTLCRVCNGHRLKPEALAVKIAETNLPEVEALSIERAIEWLRKTQKTLSPSAAKIAAEPLTQIQKRLHFLNEVGVGYLTLARPAKTLSGGESQRINLATQLGNGLCGTLYVLDEPSIGLHSSDTDRLIRVLKSLRDQGNTVVIVEHDLEVIKNADHLIELGPLAGHHGGELVASGTHEDLIRAKGSITGKYLSGALSVQRGHSERKEPTRWLKIVGARGNNLKNINVDFPLDRLVVVTGVSGSGKTTLVHKTLHAALSKLFYRTNEPIEKFDRLYGAEQIAGVVLLDQTPIGRSSRSNPATYLKAWDEVRRIYANQTLSLKRGYTPQHFSFNVDGGRCSVCKGEGEIALDMHFMAEIKLPCEECDGRRFKKNVLEVKYRSKNVYELLKTTIDEAYELFRDNATLARKFSILRDVGLGYLELGQSGATLSGGESQRLKIAATLEEREGKNLLYIFDEPTTGLHLDDVNRLLGVMQDLVDDRNSIIMIEHHLDVIAAADWLIDIGPGGGEHGGQLIGAGPPQLLASSSHSEKSTTGKTLRDLGYFEARP